MTDQTIDQPVNIEPTQETFDLDSFIVGRTTMPISPVVVYLDQDGGFQLGKLYDERDELHGEMANLEAQDAPLLGISEANPMTARKDAISERLAQISAEIMALEDRVRSSALLIEFQVQSPEQVTDALKASVASLDDEQKAVPQAVNANNFTYLMAALCLRITNAQEQVIHGPVSVESVKNLRERLVTTENTKLIDALNAAISAGANWSDRIDAGFPGRSTDPA